MNILGINILKPFGGIRDFNRGILKDIEFGIEVVFDERYRII
jgi:hypothetical protein